MPTSTVGGMTPLNPHLPDLDFTDGDWSRDFDNDDITEPDDDGRPVGLALLLAVVLGYVAVGVILAVVAAALIPFLVR